MAFPGTLNIEYYKGDTYTAILYPVDSSGNAFNLTGYSGTFNVATARGTAGTFKASIALTIDPILGTVTYTIPAATGATWSAGTSLVYDIEITKGTEVYTLLTGSIVVTDDVKKS